MSEGKAAVEEVPDEDFDAVNADALEDDTAEDSPVVSEYSTEDEDVSTPGDVHSECMLSSIANRPLMPCCDVISVDRLLQMHDANTS